MKRNIYLLLVLILVSCGKSTYYVYEESVYNEIKKKNIILKYYTFEVTRKKEIIFKAVSNNFGSDFVYIYTDRYNSTANDEKISFCRNFCMVDYLYSVRRSEWKFAPIHNSSNNWEIAYTNYDEKKLDTLKLLDRIKMADIVLEDEGFKAAGIYWFPPYIVKTKKIDYNKFYEYSPALKKVDVEKKKLQRNYVKTTL